MNHHVSKNYHATVRTSYFDFLVSGEIEEKGFLQSWITWWETPTPVFSALVKYIDTTTTLTDLDISSLIDVTHP
jgi:hypothetical protein